MAIFQRSLTATAAAATVFAALALPVWAQAPATPASPATTSAAVEPGARPAHAKAEGQHRQHRGHEAHGKRIAERTQKLQAALQLTEGQLAGWTSYRETLQPTPRAKPLDRESFAKLTTPERIDQMHQRRAEHNAQADRRAEATKAFYATLTPAQQKTFDAQTLRHGRHPGARHHGNAHSAQPSAAISAATDQSA